MKWVLIGVVVLVSVAAFVLLRDDPRQKPAVAAYEALLHVQAGARADVSPDELRRRIADADVAGSRYDGTLTSISLFSRDDSAIRSKIREARLNLSTAHNTGHQPETRRQALELGRRAMIDAERELRDMGWLP